MTAGHGFTTVFDSADPDLKVLVYDYDCDRPREVTIEEARAGMLRVAESLEEGSAARGAWEELAHRGVFGVVLVTDEMAGLMQDGDRP